VAARPFAYDPERQELLVQYDARSANAVIGMDAGAPGPGGRGRKPATPGKPGKPRRPRSPLWARLLVAFGTVLALGSGTTIVGFRLLVREATKSIHQEDLGVAANNGGDAKAHKSVTGAKNILLVGVDSRPGQNPNDYVRSDTIMVLHVDAAHDVGYLVSIPRDTWVQIPAYNNGKQKHSANFDKINAAFADGGAGLVGSAARKNSMLLLEQTITKDFYGITFDAVAIIDFTGFQQVVKVLGGVDMCVDEETKSIHNGYKNGKLVQPGVRLNSDGTVAGPIPGVTPKVYKKGCQHLEAWEALDFVRQRDLLENHDSDYGRQRHQQQFLKALFKEIVSKGVLTNRTKLTGVLNTVGEAMTVDNGGISIEDWLFAMKGIGGDDLFTMKTNGGTFHPETIGGLKVETLDDTSLQMLQAVRNDTMSAFVQTHAGLVANS
jgi:LCP family protein required for cell wall assembly